MWKRGAEKALKAAFQKMGAEAWGHSVVGLLKELSARVKVPPGLLEACQELDKAYVPTRYPNAFPSGSPSQYYNKKEAGCAVIVTASFTPQ